MIADGVAVDLELQAVEVERVAARRSQHHVLPFSLPGGGDLVPLSPRQLARPPAHRGAGVAQILPPPLVCVFAQMLETVSVTLRGDQIGGC
jgi:hypothetical protein